MDTQNIFILDFHFPLVIIAVVTIIKLIGQLGAILFKKIYVIKKAVVLFMWQNISASVFISCPDLHACAHQSTTPAWNSGELMPVNVLSNMDQCSFSV